MATVPKDFKIKQGLVVEGTTATVDGKNILVENTQGTDSYILNLIGGETLITSVDTNDFTTTGGELAIAEGSDIARSGDITAAIDALTTDDIEEGTSKYFSDYLAQTAVSNALGTGLSYGDQGSGNVFHVDENVIATKTYADAAADAAYANAQGYAELKASDAQAAAIETASQDATTKANNAQEAAEDYADGLASNYDAAGAASTAETNANSYTDSALEDYTPTSSLDTTVGGYGYLKSADLSSYATETYVNTAVDNLVDGAPGLLDTLNEIAAAINDDANYATTMTTALAGKQNELTAGDNISIVSDTISVTGLASTDISDFDSAALSATSAAYDAAGAAAAITPTSLGLGNVDNTSDANKPVSTATQTALDAKADAADPTITGSLTLDGTGDFTITSDENIVIDANTTAYLNSATSGNEIATEGYVDTAVGNVTVDFSTKAGANLDWNTESSQFDVNVTDVITNGDIATNTSVASDITTAIDALDTDDIEEGETNLYFTDQKAVDALEAVVPDFTAVEINSVAKQVAATSGLVATASTVTAYSFDKASYHSAKFLIKTAYGSHTELTEVLLTIDTLDNVHITEYANIGTNGSSMTVTADVDGANVRLRITTLNNNSTVNVVGTLLA